MEWFEKFSSCSLINTGDLLAGKTGATRHEILDAMIAQWMSDPVHGTKTGLFQAGYEAGREGGGGPGPQDPRQKGPHQEASCLSRGRARNFY